MSSRPRGRPRPPSSTQPCARSPSSQSPCPGADTRRVQPGHRAGQVFFLGPPLEELLQSPVLVAGVGAAVTAQQPDHPPLDIRPADLLPPGPERSRNQV